MASASTKRAATTLILKPSITLKGHGEVIQSISYFPDGQQMISGSGDKTARQWDLKTGKKIEEARGDCKGSVWAVAVSRNGRWVATGVGTELRACEVETGIVKIFKGHSRLITCIDISADNTQLASGSWDQTAQIWNMDTGKLVAGPFKSEGPVGAVRFSPNSKKLAVKLFWGTCLKVWVLRSSSRFNNMYSGWARAVGMQFFTMLRVLLWVWRELVDACWAGMRIAVGDAKVWKRQVVRRVRTRQCGGRWYNSELFEASCCFA
jgi:hypothetical protein